MRNIFQKSVIILGFFLVFGCKKESAPNNDLFWLGVLCLQPVYEQVPVTANTIKILSSGSIIAVYQQDYYSDTHNSSKNDPKMVSLAVAGDGLNFENRSMSVSGISIHYTFLSDNVYYAANSSSVSYITTDAGKTWSTLPYENTWGGPRWVGGYIDWVAFADSNHGLRSLRGDHDNSGRDPYYIDFTTDGGSTWNRKNSAGDLYLEVAEPYYYSTSKLYLKMRDYLSTDLYESFDNGNSYTKKYAFSRSGREQLFYTDNANGWISGTLRKTTDGGATWSAQATNVANNSFNKVKFLNASIGYGLVTVTPGSLIKLMKTNDGGSNWSEVVLPFTTSVSGTFGIGGGKVAISHDNKVYVSTDDFITFQKLDPGLTETRESKNNNFSKYPFCSGLTL